MKVGEAWLALREWAENQYEIDREMLLAQLDHLEWEYE